MFRIRNFLLSSAFPGDVIEEAMIGVLLYLLVLPNETTARGCAIGFRSMSASMW